MRNTTRPRRTAVAVIASLTAAAALLCLLSADLAAKGKPGGGGGGSSAPQYAVVSLGSFAADGLTHAYKLNNTGGVLVSSGGGSGPAILMELDNSAAIQRVVQLTGPDTSDQATSASDLNDEFDVVGAAFIPVNQNYSASQAILWRVPESGSLETIELTGFPVTPGNQRISGASGISSNGLIVGREQEVDIANQVLVRDDVIVWQTDALGVLTHVALPGGVEPEDVNSFGVVTGVADQIGPAIWVLQFDQDGLLSGASGPVALPGLGGEIVYVYQITDGGGIAGAAMTATGEQHAVVWTVDANGNVLALDDLGILARFERTATSGVNDQTVAVGNAYREQKVGMTFSPDSTPFYADASGMVDFNGLVSDFGGLKSLELALDVNQNGWICGQAVSRTDIHPYVAIPLP